MLPSQMLSRRLQRLPRFAEVPPPQQSRSALPHPARGRKDSLTWCSGQILPRSPRDPAAVLSHAAAPRADLCYRGAGLAAACRPGAQWGPGVEISRPVPGRSAGIRPGHPGRHMFAQPWLRRRPSRATGWSCSPGAQDG